MGMIPDLSFWLSWRKRLTDRFLPEPKWLPRLYHKPPYWYGFRFSLNAQQTLEQRQAARHNCWLVTVSGKSYNRAGFQVRIRMVRGSVQFSQVFEDQAIAMGQGAKRYWFRIPQRMRQGDTIIVEVKNVATVAQTCEVVLEAVEDVKLPDRSS
jgi:hypothetical protein